MTRRIVQWALGFVVVAAGVLTFLILTGERGLSPKPSVVRSVEGTRLDNADAERLGWSPTRLTVAVHKALVLSTDSFVIVTGGEVVQSFGVLDTPYATHSMRKSFLSALVGQHVGSGDKQIRLDATLQDLGIDDAPLPLTPGQKQATVRHLLKSVSGINHPAAASGGLQADIDRRLGHDENAPGTIWAYNNWDYNALTTIFETETGSTIAPAFADGIAGPIGLEDFDADAVSYIADTDLSIHKAASFKMSARDLVKVGQLYLHKGRVEDRQIIPESWIERITSDFAETGRDDLRWAHGYLWWIPGPETGLPQGTFWAWGLGNQALIVIPAWDTVIVHQSDTTEFLKRFVPMIETGDMTGEAALEQLVLECRGREARKTAYCRNDRFITRREFDGLISAVVAARL